MALILGIRTLQALLNFRFYTTVQHEYLIRILQKSLNLPFFANEIITIPTKVPNDNYWRRSKNPKIYYLDGRSDLVSRSCESYLYYLNLLGIETVFFQSIETNQINYSTFWKSWNAS